MNQQTTQCEYGDACPVCADWQGVMPYCGPLANPYVPYQLENGERYQANKALARGTLFPGLEFPFRGMVNETRQNMSALEQIQSVGFAINELGLYLDTHRNDAEAIDLFNRYAEMYEELVQQYQQNGGSLTQIESAMSGKYDWLREPWPWEYREEG